MRTDSAVSLAEERAAPFGRATAPEAPARDKLAADAIYCGDARSLLRQIEPESIALSFWSPPYFVGKLYEATWSFSEWKEVLSRVVALHFPILRPGGFLAINIADILAFPDEAMPRIQADNVSTKRVKITREQVLQAKMEHPAYNRHQLASLLGCSEQTIQRRLEHNNVRGGKYDVQRKVQLVGGLIQEWAEAAGFYLYDRRIWMKDPCWENSQWHSLSYRSVDEFEYIYIFWKPGITTVDRHRLTKKEWSDWGSRGIWRIPSVRVNSRHEAEFPVELPRRAIRLLSAEGDTVLDPFLGTGSTAVAAVEENRRYVGFDISPEWVALAQGRVEAASKRGRGRA